MGLGLILVNRNWLFFRQQDNLTRRGLVCFARIILYNFYSGPPLLTTDQCSCCWGSGGNHFTILSLLRNASKQTNKHIGPLLLCRPFCLVYLRAFEKASLSPLFLSGQMGQNIGNSWPQHGRSDPHSVGVDQSGNGRPTSRRNVKGKFCNIINGLAWWRLRDPFVTTYNLFRIKTSKKFI